MMTLYEDYVKLMERGQITLPMPIRQSVSLMPKDILRVRLLENYDIIVSPTKPKKNNIAEVLAEFKNDKHVYWTAKDEKKRQLVRKLSTERIKKLYADHR